MSQLEKKFKICTDYGWDTHRGGWNTVIRYLKDEFHHPQGTLFLSAVEDQLWYEGCVQEPWVGVLHQVPYQNQHFPDLDRIIQTTEWRNDLDYCRGIYVLCDYAGDFLRSRIPGVPIEKLPYPQESDVPPFSFKAFENTRQVVQVGEFLRNHQAFFDLDIPACRKIMLTNDEILESIEANQIRKDISVEMRARVADQEYDKILAESIVFLNLDDAVAVTAILECIVRATPVLVNRVGAVAEFLGEDYPLYYQSLEDAKSLIHRPEKILEAHVHLKESHVRQELTFEALEQAIQHSPIYENLSPP